MNNIFFHLQEAAEAALDLNMTKFKSRVLAVSLSVANPSKRQATTIIRPVAAAPNSDAGSPQPSSDTAAADPAAGSNHANTTAAAAREDDRPSRETLQSRTVALLNVPDTINDARIRALMEPYGALTKVMLRPERESALVEFATVRDAGRAALGVEGHEIAPGRCVTVGSVKDVRGGEHARSEPRERRRQGSGGDKAGGGGGGGGGGAPGRPEKNRMRKGPNGTRSGGGGGDNDGSSGPSGSGAGGGGGRGSIALAMPLNAPIRRPAQPATARRGGRSGLGFRSGAAHAPASTTTTSSSSSSSLPNQTSTGTSSPTTGGGNGGDAALRENSGEEGNRQHAAQPSASSSSSALTSSLSSDTGATITAPTTATTTATAAINAAPRRNTPADAASRTDTRAREDGV
jgi:hypothetical protein